MATTSPPSIASTGSAPPPSISRRSPSIGSIPSGRLLPQITARRSPLGRGAVMERDSIPGASGPDVDEVAVGDDVVPSLDPQGAALPGGGIAPRVHELLPGDLLRAHERALDVAVHPPGGVVGGAAPAQRPRHRLLAGVRREEGDEV